MEKSDEYFRSPHPQNFLNFFSPFQTLRNMNSNDEEIFQNNLFSQERKNRQSPFHLYHPNHEENNADMSDNSNLNKQPKLISNVIDFQDEIQQDSEQENGFIQNIQKFELSTPKKKGYNMELENIQTTPRKKYQLRPIDIVKQHHAGRDNQRGLRGLSKQAFQVLKNSEPLTYQEVAQKIIQQNDQLGQKNNTKQSQGIKRRVYDALNVLIAVGLLTKDGRKISYINESKGQTKKSSDIKRAIEEKIQFRKMAITMKKAEIRRFKSQHVSLNKLIERNTIQEIAVNSTTQQPKIYFPFIFGAQIVQSPHERPHQKVFNKFICGDLDAICSIDFFHQK